jgi:hypothetical protein
MKKAIFLKNVLIKKGVDILLLSNGPNKSIANFRETIPLKLHIKSILNRLRCSQLCEALKNGIYFWS